MRSREEIIRFLNENRSYFESFIYVDLIGGSFSPVEAGQVKLQFVEADTAFTNGKVICFGIGGFKESEDLLSDSLYYLGHELAHLHSTTQKDWQVGNLLGVQAVMRDISKRTLGYVRPIRSQKDLTLLCQNLSDAGVEISPDKVHQIIFQIQNLIEDGRVDGIRCMRYPGFRKFSRRFHRPIWDRREVKEDVENMSPGEKLSVIMSQIFFLANLQWWQKGFLAQYIDENDGIYDFCYSLLPELKAAISAPSCRKCMKHVASICERLAPYILDAAKADELPEIAMPNADYSFGREDQPGTGDIPQPLYGVSVFDDDQNQGQGKNEDENQNHMSGDANSESGTNNQNQDQRLKNDDSGAQNQNQKLNNDDSDSNSEGRDKDQASDSKSNSNSNSGKQDQKHGNDSGNGDSDNAAASASASENSSASDADSKDSPKSNDSSNQLDGAGSDSSFEEYADSYSNRDEADMKRIRDAAEEAAREMARRINTVLTVDNPNPSEPFDTSLLRSYYDGEEGEVTLNDMKRDYAPDQILPYALHERAEDLKRVVQQKLQVRRRPTRKGQRSGCFNHHKAARLAMGQLTCFNRRGESSKKDVAVYVLIDNSGSMNGEKSVYAMEAAAVIEHAFSELCPIKMTAFNADSSLSVTHRLIKDWEEHGSANLSYNFLLHNYPSSMNKDGYSIRVATHDLANRPERYKLLLVLSDGLPSAYPYSAGVADVCDAVQNARAQGITTMGMFFPGGEISQADQSLFRTMYGEQSICIDPSRIEEELIRIMDLFFFDY